MTTQSLEISEKNKQKSRSLSLSIQPLFKSKLVFVLDAIIHLSDNFKALFTIGSYTAIKYILSLWVSRLYGKKCICNVSFSRANIYLNTICIHSRVTRLRFPPYFCWMCQWVLFLILGLNFLFFFLKNGTSLDSNGTRGFTGIYIFFKVGPGIFQ